MIPELRCHYSTISAKELIPKVLPDYCIEPVIDCLFWERGTNDTYQVRCKNARYSLRIYRHEIYPRDEIDFEVDALNYLHENGFPVAFPIARKSGEYVTEIMALEGLRYVLVTAFIDGKPPEYESIDDSKLFGRSLAELHQVSQRFTSTHKKKTLDVNNLIDDSLVTVKPHLSHRPDDLSYLLKIAEQASAAVEQVGDDAMDIGFCHGDIHGYNAHLNDGVLTHYDFEECGFGYRVYDLATFKWSFSSRDSGADHGTAFLDGYQSVRKVNDADLRLLDTFVLIRQVWLIAFHMRNAEDFGHGVTSDDYIDYQWKKLRKFSENV